MHMGRFFEVVVKNNKVIAEDDLPDRNIGKRWDPKWKKLGYRKMIVLFELTDNSNGILTYSCPGPFHIKIPVPKTGKLRKKVFDILDAAQYPDGAVKLTY
jgi:hypothetical protein